MVTTEQERPGRASVAQRWLARLALVAAAAAVLVPLAGIGFRASVALVLVGMAGLALTAAGIWWALTHKGLVRWLAVAVAVLAPLVVLVLYTSSGLLWVVLVALGLLAVAVAAGRAALAREAVPEKMREHDAPPPRKPYLIMNPRSGGGKVTKFGLKDKAEALGAEVALLEGPGTVDVGALARTAVANGADLLGVAGGDGTQALVAGIAAEHNLPLLVISAGTRNHFALDLGLDREDPSRCLDALTDGVELQIDLGIIGGRPFVNNASFGAYAAVVQSPAYRDDKRGTTLDQLPGLLAGQQGSRLVARAENVTVQGPQAVLVSNNQYGMGDIAGLGRRARLDRATLGMFAVTVSSAAQAAGLLRGRNSRGLTSLTSREVVIDADTAQIPVGVDGEALVLDTPVRCTIQPAALRVRVPRDRPGVPDPKPIMDWKRLRRMALTVSGPGGG
ncbi:MAG TPA: diacylglycerol kinase family protein [Actinomycetota bacterium]|jgi:diacylglycerol kinase family enzyme|nr:diacylglycerol kinase family protein [Actinomycetota bacterium]